MQMGREITNPAVEHLITDYTLSLMGLSDQYTTGHCNEVASVVTKAARDMGFSGRDLENVTLAGHLHDVGKQGIPNSILVKPGALTPSEFRLIQDHVEIGVNLLNSIGFNPQVVRYVAEHHERLDGSGYPFGLKGDEISVGGQLLGIADVASALTSKRTYRTAFSKDELKTFLEECCPVQFNADLVQVVLSHCE